MTHYQAWERTEGVITMVSVLKSLLYLHFMVIETLGLAHYWALHQSAGTSEAGALLPTQCLPVMVHWNNASL